MAGMTPCALHRSQHVLDRFGVTSRDETAGALAEADRQVGRTDVDAVDSGRRTDLVRVRHAVFGLDHHEAQHVRVEDICVG